MKHLIACNHIQEVVQDTADVGLVFKSDVFDFDEAIMITVSDVSWANEDKVVNNKVFPRRSQFGKLVGKPRPRLEERTYPQDMSLDIPCGDTGNVLCT